MQLRLAHIGINTEGETETQALAELLATMLNCDTTEGNSSIFVCNKEIEIMKSAGRGTHGHIAFQTELLEEIKAEMERAGCVFDPSSEKYDKEGRLKAVYLEGEFGGFAIHLVR